jgi:hypothetical protein
MTSSRILPTWPNPGVGKHSLLGQVETAVWGKQTVLKCLWFLSWMISINIASENINI